MSSGNTPNPERTESELRAEYLELLLSKAKMGGGDEILNRIERVLGLAESDTELHDRIERTLTQMRLAAREDSEVSS